MTTDDAYSFLLDNIVGATNIFAPLKLKNVSNKCLKREAWITKGLIKSSRKREKLYKRCCKLPRDDPLYQKYILYRNKYNCVKLAAKQRYYRDVLNE